MKRVSRDQIGYVFDRRTPPVLEVEPGELFCVETEDSRTGRTRTPAATTPDALRAMRATGYLGNPVTGPIHVRGAEPGDALRVRIAQIDCDTLGYFGYWPEMYGLADLVPDPVTGLVEIRDGQVEHAWQTACGEHRVRFACRPMIGAIGTAPAVEAILSSFAGRHGGNLDVPEISAGSVLHLPVSVPGGLLFLGDCHAHQGDGEVSGIEMRSVVTLSVELVQGGARTQHWLRCETPTHLVTIACDRPLENAQHGAIREMLHWLRERYGWSLADARRLVGLASELRPGQVQVGLYSLRLLVDKRHLPEGEPSSRPTV